MASDRRSITTVLRAETGQYQQAMDAAAKSTAKVGTSAAKSSRQASGAYKGLADGARRASGSFQDLSDGVGKSGFSLDEWQKKVEGQAQATQKWSDNIAKLADRGASVDLLSGLIQQGPQASAAIDALANGTEEDLKRAEAAITSMNNASSGLGDKLAGGAQKSQSAFDRMAASVSKNEQAWQTVGTTLTVAGGAVTAFGVAALKTGIEYNTLQQTSRAALESLLGSAQAANEQMDKLDEFARSSPFSKQTFITAQQQMLAFGIEAKKVVPYLDAIQNAVAAAGGSNNDIAEISAVFSKVQSSAKITAQDLMELGNRGVNAAELIGSQMGMTGAQVRDSITAGTLDAQEALDALAAGMSDRFDGAADNVKNTFSGAVDRVKAAWRDFSAELAAPLVDPEGGGALVSMLNGIADAMRGFQDLPDSLKKLTSGVGLFAGALAVLGGGAAIALPKLLEIKTAFSEIAPAGGKARTVLGKFGKVAGGVLAVATALEVLNAATEKTAASTDQIDRTLQNLGSSGDPTKEMFGDMVSNFDAITRGADSFAETIDVAANQSGLANWVQSFAVGVSRLFGNDTSIKASEMNTRLEQFGDQLGTLAQSNLPQAQSAFKAMYEEAGGGAAAGQNLLKAMPGLKESLTQIATNAGLATDDATLLKIALGEVSVAATDTTAATGDLASSQDILANALASTDPEIAAQAQQYQDLIDGVSKAGASFTDFSDDLGDAGFSLDGWLDKLESQQKAMANWSDNIATLVKKGASKELLQNLIDQGPAAAKAVAGLANGTEKDLKRAENAVGGTSGKLQNLKDILGDEFVLELNTVPAQQEGESAAAYISRLSAIIEVNGDAVPAQKDGEDTAAYIDRLKAFIKTRAETRQAKKDGQDAVDYISGLKAIIKSNGNSLPARKDGESTVEYINRLRSMIVIDANGGPARKDGESTSKYISRLKTMITTSGNSVPARKDGESTSKYIERLKTVLDIKGDNDKAKKSGKDAQKDINGRDATIDVDADTAPAKGTVEDFISKSRKTIIKIAGKFLPSSWMPSGDGEGAGWSGGTPRGVSAMSKAVRSIEPGAHITSGYRPGAVTATGYPSYHGMGRAIDIVSPNMGATWDKLRAAFGSRAKELYYSPRGFIRNGALTNDVAPVTRAMHYSHVHLALAGGGAARGPGTGTSDDIPAWLSNGEHVLTASDVRKLGGQQEVYRLRQAIQRGTLKNLDPEPTFRTGGAVGTAERALGSARHQRAAARERLRRARAAVKDAEKAQRRAEKTDKDSDDKAAAKRLRAAEKAENAAQKRYDQKNKKVQDQAGRLSRLRSEARDTRTDVRRGELRSSARSDLSGAYGVVDQMRELARSGDLTKRQSRRLSGNAGNAEKAMRRLYKRADDLEKKLSKAKAKYDDLLSMRNSVRDSLKGGFTLAGVEGKTNPWTGETGPATGKEYKAAATKYASQMKTFSGKLKKLQKAGYPGVILQEVAEMGPEAGIPAANALLSLNPKDTKSLKGAYSSISKYSTETANTVTKGFYKGGVMAAKGMVAGLKSQEKRTNSAIAKWAKKMEKALKKALGIKSPSTVFAELGRQTGAGMVVGLNASAGAVARASEDLAHIPGTVSPSVYANPPAARSSQQVVAVVDKAAMAEAMNGTHLTLMANGKQIDAVVQTTVDRNFQTLATSLNGGRR